MPPHLRVLCLGLVAIAAPGLANGPHVLEFPANPSTGYHWVLNAAQSSGLDLVVIEDQGYGPPETDRIGAPAPARIGVSCIGSGPVHLVFDQTSPDGSTVAETRAVDLTCE